MKKQAYEIGTPVRLKWDNKLSGVIVDGGVVTSADYVVALYSSREHVDVCHDEVIDLTDISEFMAESILMIERVALLGLDDTNTVDTVEHFVAKMKFAAHKNGWDVHQAELEWAQRIAEMYVALREQLKEGKA